MLFGDRLTRYLNGAIFALLGVSSAVSLIKLTFDTYNLEIVGIVQRLVVAYEGALAPVLSKIRMVGNEVLQVLNLNVKIGAHWEDVFVWLSFFFFSMVYHPKRYKFVKLAFQVYALILAVIFSIVSGIFLPSPETFLGLCICVAPIFCGIFLYYFITDVVKGVVDRPIENMSSDERESFFEFLLRQLRALWPVLGLLFCSLLVAEFVEMWLEVRRSIVLVLLVFSFLMCVHCLRLGILDARIRVLQRQNQGKSWLQVYLAAGNTKVGMAFGRVLLFFFLLAVANYL